MKIKNRTRLSVDPALNMPIIFFIIAFIFVLILNQSRTNHYDANDNQLAGIMERVLHHYGTTRRRLPGVRIRPDLLWSALK